MNKAGRFVLGLLIISFNSSCFLNTTNSISGDGAIADGVPHLAALSSAGCFSCHVHAAWSTYKEDSQWLAALPSEFSAGDAANSDFYKRITGSAGVAVMPPSGEIMPDEDAEVIADWINAMQATR